MGSFTPPALWPRPCPFWLPFVPIDAERPHWNTVDIRTGCQKLAWFILGRQAGAVLLGWNPQIARKMGKSHSFRWAILWIILLYMFFLNKRSNFGIKPHDSSYRSIILVPFSRIAKISKVLFDIQNIILIFRNSFFPCTRHYFKHFPKCFYVPISSTFG